MDSWTCGKFQLGTSDPSNLSLVEISTGGKDGHTKRQVFVDIRSPPEAITGSILLALLSRHTDSRQWWPAIASRDLV